MTRIILLLYIFCVPCHASNSKSLGQRVNPSGVILGIAPYETSKGDETRLSCSETLRADLVFPSITKGRHRVEGYWYRPGGVLQERTDLSLDFPSGPGKKKALLWLHFQPDSDTILDEFSLNPDSASTENPFHGTWKLEVFLDGLLSGSKDFNVTCRN